MATDGFRQAFRMLNADLKTISISKYTEMIAELETHRIELHAYIDSKKKQHDYHAVADASMDLREIDAKLMIIRMVLGV